MVIRFDYGSGWMRFDPDILICDMPMTNYRKWVKLFARYATPEQHHDFLERVDYQSRNIAAQCVQLCAEVQELMDKADRKLPSVMAPKCLLQQAVQMCIRDRCHGA